MRQIKFRGRRSNGQIVRGGLLYKRSTPMIAVTHVLKYPVEPSSIAQLVTVIDGVEIYEGDTFERDGKIYRATLAEHWQEAENETDEN